jgi:hypothetical protein
MGIKGNKKVKMNKSLRVEIGAKMTLSEALKGHRLARKIKTMPMLFH